MTDVVVVGGGASGMLAAGMAAARGLDVVLLEPNRNLGKKLRITGKGRCNITNNCDVREFIANVPRNGKFLYSAINTLPPKAAMDFFESLGLPLKTERGNRVFPVSDRAVDVAQALERFVLSSGAKVRTLAAKRIVAENGAVKSVLTKDGPIHCCAAIICTGGISYPATGSTGDGYRMAHELGHSVVKPRASLVPLVGAGDICARMMGLSLKNVRLSAFEDEVGIFEDFGELLFTHFGVSGPLALSASAHMRSFGEKKYALKLDLKPALDEKTLNARVLSDFSKYKNSDFINSLSDLLPVKMIPVIVELSGIDPRVKTHSVKKEQRLKLIGILKAFPINVLSPRPIEEAVITSGGVNVNEVDARTMRSKLISGLYFAGEVLDVDAYTGGFNLQIAWSTACVAASSLI